MSAPAVRAEAAKWPEKAPNRNQYAPRFDAKRNQVASAEFLDFNTRASEGCADHP